MEHKPFAYRALADVRAEAQSCGAFLPLSEDLTALSAPLTAGGVTFQNRLAVQPMEGCDGTSDGAPGELTARRYARFASGGAGLIWFEAVAVSPESRGSPRQLMLTRGNLDAYKRLLEDMRETAVKASGSAPPVVIQATHSGRYSRPGKDPAPLIACNNPLYEKTAPLGADRIVSDSYLDSLPERYAEAARLSRMAGFDGVDVKACHRYLLSELLAARTREGSRYGGSFEGRIKLFLDAAEAVKSEISGGMLLTSRLNVYDGAEYPYGFGVSEGGGLTPDFAEPLELIGRLRGLGMRLINITAGNPYVNPHVNRPFDKGFYTPPEHPLEGLGRMYSCAKAVKDAYPDMTVAASGLSYLRQFSPHAAAGLLACGAADIAGFGREAFAYPEFAKDMLNGAVDKDKCCISCGKCTELMRAGSTAGCVVRDAVYSDIYRRDVAELQ
jgi:2,4-dienoyl-CoA reductase-like NADH-dependent reductase (Old Yellow Enzyme family)